MCHHLTFFYLLTFQIMWSLCHSVSVSVFHRTREVLSQRKYWLASRAIFTFQYRRMRAEWEGLEARRENCRKGISNLIRIPEAWASDAQEVSHNGEMSETLLTFMCMLIVISLITALQFSRIIHCWMAWWSDKREFLSGSRMEKKNSLSSVLHEFYARFHMSREMEATKINFRCSWR